MLIKLIRKNEVGFTLIELMIVIAIIGILAAIAVPQFKAYRFRAFNALAQSDLKNATIAQEAYYVDNQEYADTLDKLTGADTPDETKPSYGLTLSQGVTLEITEAGNAEYTIRSWHSTGDKTYTITGPGGVIEATNGIPEEVIEEGGVGE